MALGGPLGIAFVREYDATEGSAPPMLPGISGGIPVGSSWSGTPIYIPNRGIAGALGLPTMADVGGPINNFMEATSGTSKVPCYPNVSDFVDAHKADAQRIATQIGNGVTAQEVLSTSAGETTYGTSNIAQHGNFFGLHGPGPYSGQIGTYLTQPTSGKGVITPEFPTSNGFLLSGQEFANRESPFLSSVTASDPQTFFSTIHAHGYGTTNSSYMNNMMGYKSKTGKIVNGVYSLVGACL
jgi:hypothetical protein